MLRYFYLLIFLSHLSYSQCTEKASGNEKVAQNYITFGQYKCALDEYLIIYEKKPEDVDVNLAIAECYVGIPGSGPKAIKYLEFLLTQKKINPSVRILLCMAYMQSYEFDKAIEQANLFKKEFPSKVAEIKVLDDVIQSCNNAKQIIKLPLNYRAENLGKDVNSAWDDYSPISTANEDQILFNTTRQGTVGGFSMGNGYISDVFMTNLKGLKYSKARSLGTTFNSIDIDEIAGSSADLKHLFISTDADGFQILKLKVSKITGKATAYPKPVDVMGVNEGTSNIKSATINNEGNILIYASDRAGGAGGYDLYLSRVLPDGSWGIPVNLKALNTPKDELYPQFNHEQNAMIFSSDGHFNMGGADLFETSFNEDFTEWKAPRNLGHPINTPFDDHSVCFIPGNRYAYKSDYRADSYGMSDVYRFVFLDSTPQFTVVNAKISLDSITNVEMEKLNTEIGKKTQVRDSLSAILASGENAAILAKVDTLNQAITKLNSKLTAFKPNFFTEIIATNLQDNSMYGQYKSNPNKGGVVMILEPGKYELSIEAEGFFPITKTFEILDKSSFVPFLQKEFILKKK